MRARPDPILEVKSEKLNDMMLRSLKAQWPKLTPRLRELYRQLDQACRDRSAVRAISIAERIYGYLEGVKVRGLLSPPWDTHWATTLVPIVQHGTVPTLCDYIRETP